MSWEKRLTMWLSNVKLSLFIYKRGPKVYLSHAINRFLQPLCWVLLELERFYHWTFYHYKSRHLQGHHIIIVVGYILKEINYS